MRVLRLTDTAEQDLVEIGALIAQDNPAEAKTFLRKLQERFLPLLTHPEIGPARDNLTPGLRAHFYTDYVIYYLASDKEIIIVRVLHRSRDARAVLNDEDVDEKEG